eukprot:TRINITY_DN1627_c0_g1_i1.p1 TRINITY_DN1627_c0_g1~~TRINITY_DN1627_c0_g1_i1.p1  ORF type:complete len:352 (+),score=75.82 TRINITY_DN1627_c0_g1_i1:44-1057(+)
MANVVRVASAEETDVRLQKHKKVVLTFFAEWSGPSKQMVAVIEELSKSYVDILFLIIPAEDLEEIATRYGVKSVPFFVFINSNKVVDQLSGANPPELTKRVEKLQLQMAAGNPVTAARSEEDPQKALNARLKKLTSYAPVMVFIKGTPAEPKCKFSRALIGFLKEQKVNYCSFNILSDDSVRQGLKTFSNWPTYPQVYVKGELIGGLDVVKDMAEEGTFLKKLPAEAINAAPAGKEALYKRLDALLKSNRVMLFMKGVPAAPQCGFSNKIVALLESIGVKYGSFDILSDNAVRQGLKEYSNWPTYPQLYLDGKLLGGLDVVTQMHEEDSLAELLLEK